MALSEGDLTALNASFAVIILALTAGYAYHQRKIKSLVRSVLREDIHPRLGPAIHEAVSLKLAGWVYANVDFTLKDPLFLPLPGFRWMGASPLTVARLGGCCSGKSRLLICLLKAAEQQAYQVSVYHRSGVARHCLVQAASGYHEVLLDPLYGIRYHGGNGQSFGLKDLRAGAKHGYLPLPQSEESGYPASEYYDFNFNETRTAGWTQSRLHRIAYRGLRALTKGRIDTWPQPWWMEWPQLLLAGQLIIAWLCINLIAAVVGA